MALSKCSSISDIFHATPGRAQEPPKIRYHFDVPVHITAVYAGVQVDF